VAAAIGLVVVAGVGAWAAKRAHATAAPQATIGSASGSASAAPAPVSSNAEAARLYAEGWETWRTDSNVEGIGAWQRAVKLDPELCPAQLRLALYALGLPDRTGPVAFEAARRCAPKLSERDRALLEVAAPLFAPRWDQSAFAATAAKIALAFPDDPEVQYARAEGLASSDPAAAVTAYDRVIQLDPKFVHAYVGKQAALARLGKTEEAERALRDCLAASPGAVFCAFAERHILLETGRCADTESVARAFIQDRPSNPAGYGWLADALLGRGAPQEAVEAALEQARERYGPEALGEYTTRFVFMESTKEFYGDFAAALALMDQRAEAGAKQYTVAQQAIAVVQRARVLQEIGRTDEARSVMRSFLRRSDGYAFTTEADKVAAVAAGVSLGIEPLSALVDLVNRAPDYLPKDPTPAQRWGGTYVWDDPSPAFAREAVAKIPRGDDLQGVRTLVSPEVIPLVLRQVGTTLARGGRPDLAVPWLREGLKGCVQIVELELAPSQALSRFHAELELGKALEAQGDKAGAREQYQSILRYWGDAKPRSVTADEARRRLATLGP
jgi:tetratricopeptide (TPR) repeat protein